jgi:hypothetical protein
MGVRRRDRTTPQRSQTREMLDYLIQRAMLEAGMDRRAVEDFARRKELGDIEYERQLELGDIRDRRQREAETRQETRTEATEQRGIEQRRTESDEAIAASTAVDFHSFLTEQNYPPHLIAQMMGNVQQQLTDANPAMGARFGEISANIPELGVEDWTRRALTSHPRPTGASNENWVRQLERNIPGLAGIYDRMTNLDNPPVAGASTPVVPTFPLDWTSPGQGMVQFPYQGVRPPVQTPLEDPEDREMNDFIDAVLGEVEGEGREQKALERETLAHTEARQEPKLGWGVAYATDPATGIESPRMILGNHKTTTTWDESGTPTTQTTFVPDPSYNLDPAVDTIAMPDQSAQQILSAEGDTTLLGAFQMMLTSQQADEVPSDDTMKVLQEAVTQGRSIDIGNLFRRDPTLAERVPELREVYVPQGDGPAERMRDRKRHVTQDIPPQFEERVIGNPAYAHLTPAQQQDLQQSIDASRAAWLTGEGRVRARGTEIDQLAARVNREAAEQGMPERLHSLGIDKPSMGAAPFSREWSELEGTASPMQSIGRNLKDFRTPPAFDPTAEGVPGATAAFGDPIAARVRGFFADKAPFGLGDQGEHAVTEPLPTVAPVGVRQSLAQADRERQGEATRQQNELAARNALTPETLARLPHAADMMEHGQLRESPNIATADDPPVPGTTILAQEPDRLRAGRVPVTPGSRMGWGTTTTPDVTGVGWQQAGLSPAVDPTLPMNAMVADQIGKYFTGISPDEHRVMQQMIMNMIQGESSGRPYDESGRVLEGDSGQSLGLLQVGPGARADVGTDPMRMGIPAGQLQTGLAYLLNLIGGRRKAAEPTYGADSGITSARDALAAYNMGPGKFMERKQGGAFTDASPYGPSSDYVQKALGGISPEDESLLNQYIQRYQRGF